MFYSDNCEPCVLMGPLISKLEKSEDVRVERLEVWYNQENKKLLGEYAGFATIPFFYNEKTKKKISGETDYKALKNLALSR